MKSNGLDLGTTLIFTGERLALILLHSIPCKRPHATHYYIT